MELLPVYQFDPSTAPDGLVNYWGYQPISFFAPHTAYSARQDPLGVLDEFRDMVKALHRAGIEVILDVVYNHTAEGFGGSATLCYRGLADDAYYILDSADKARYADYTGCGNTGRTQQGNNNAYCQENAIAWFDWTLLDKHADVHRFTKHLIADRLGSGGGRSDNDTLLELLHRVQIELHGVDFGPLDEGETSHTLAMSRTSADGLKHLYLMVNAYWELLDFTLPAAPVGDDQGWRLWIDTSRPSPDDIHAWAGAPPIDAGTYRVGPRSVVALVAMAGGNDVR